MPQPRSPGLRDPFPYLPRDRRAALDEGMDHVDFPSLDRPEQYRPVHPLAVDRGYPPVAIIETGNDSYRFAQGKRRPKEIGHGADAGPSDGSGP